MGKPPTTDQELTARVAALEQRADATDAAMATLQADNEELQQQIDGLEARVTALEDLVTTGKPPVIGGGPILPPDRIDNTLPQPEPPDVVPPDPPAAGTLQAIVTMGDSTFTFNETEATDIGSISDPLAPVLGISSRFTMSCLLQTLPGCPLRVYFRRIAAPNAWCSIVFEHGDALGGEAAGFPPYGPYNVTVTDGNGGTHTYSAVTHYYFTRWRHKFNAWPFPVTPTATLISKKLVPNYDVTVAAGKYTDPGDVAPPPPMSISNIPPYMSQGGEGDVIGLFDGWQGAYLTGVHTDPSAVLNQMEGSCGEPWHHRDVATGAPVDTVTYPNCSMFPNAAAPWLGWADGASYSIYPGVQVDVSHMPDKSYLPFVMHGDPFMLEEMQFVANFTVLNMPAGNRGAACNWNKDAALRAMAWGARNRARCTLCTPTSVPGWLKPKSYWQTMMDQELSWLMTNMVNNPAAPYSGLHMGDGDANGSYATGNIGPNILVAPWQDGYLGSAFGHIVEIGFSSWLPVATWHAAYLVGLNDGTSGWNRSTGILYRLAIRETETAPYVNTFTDLYNVNISLAVDGVSPPGTSQAHRVSVSNYDVGCCAALAIYARMGLTGAEECRAWLLGEVQTLIPSGAYALQWSIR